MKKKLIFIFSVFISTLLFSQVGINTRNPQQLFHTDGKYTEETSNPDEGIPSKVQQFDDVVITDEGRIGIGTIFPNSKLHIISNQPYEALQIQDGSEGEKKVLTSNEFGQASWVSSSITTPVVFGDIDTSTSFYNVYEDQYIKSKIILPKGRWLVYIGKLFNPNSNASSSQNTWLRLTLSSSENSLERVGFNFLSSSLVSGWLENINHHANRFVFLSGVIPVEVINEEGIILYLRTREFNQVGTPIDIRTRSYGEDYLFGVPTN